MARAVVLLSGGMDSATALAVAKSNACSCFALSIDYGQRHQYELKQQSQSLNIWVFWNIKFSTLI